MLPFLALPLAFSARRLPWLFVPLAALSLFYVLLATAVEPRVPYPYAHPTRDLFLANYLEGRFALGRGHLFGEERLLTADSTAFNLGKLAGLPGAWQLAPLLAAWVVLGGRLARAAALADGASAAMARAVASLLLLLFAAFFLACPHAAG
jgi:hypothetical protein